MFNVQPFASVLRRRVAMAFVVASMATGFAHSADQVKLANPGFEEGVAGWEPAVYGAKSDIAVDSQIKHGGRASLRISSREPSDTAVAQNVQLKPSQGYRLTAWIKTEALDPLGSPASGAVQVQSLAGADILGASPNMKGDADWTQVKVLFVAPPDGLAHIALFFVGFGKGTGTVWFDDISLEEADLSKSPITVTRNALCPGSISPMQYGQFIEYLCDLVPAMWAEKLYDGSFEGLSPYMFTFIKETDFKEKPWYPVGATNRGRGWGDINTQISGDHSMRIEVPSGPPCVVGIAQDGIALKKGERLQFSIYTRLHGAKGPVKVSLHNRYGKVFAKGEVPADITWSKQTIELVPNTTANDATITIEFHAPGALWLDNASLMPADNVHGWRKDVFEALKALKPAIIRTGGSVLEEPSMGNYEWQYLVGDPDRRKPFRAWGGLQNPKAGLGEFIDLCRMVGAEPLFCVPFSRRTPQSAAEMVEYFNGAVTTPMGAKRAEDGHPQPYKVKYWQVGNERFGKDFDDGIAAFCEAMLKVDPTIKLFANYPTEGTIKNAGNLISYVCPHHYGCDNLEWCKSDIQTTRELIKKFAPGRDIRIAVTEWNTTAGDWNRRSMLWTLSNALACSRYHNLMHRNADIVEIANRSNMTNSFCSGIIQTDAQGMYKTPTWYAQWLYANLAGTKPLKIDSEIPVDVGLDISATLNDKGDELVLFVINDGTAAASRVLDLSAFGKSGQAVDVWTLADTKKSGEPDATNTFAEPERIKFVQSTTKLDSPKFTYRFPALSLTVIRWKVAH
jgi:alpha-N-arabinofuranosidase